MLFALVLPFLIESPSFKVTCAFLVVRGDLFFFFSFSFNFYDGIFVYGSGGTVLRHFRPDHVYLVSGAGLFYYSIVLTFFFKY